MIKELAAAEEEKAKVVRKVILFEGGGITLCPDRCLSLSPVSFSFHINLRKLSLLCQIVHLPLCNKIKDISPTPALLSRESLFVCNRSAAIVIFKSFSFPTLFLAFV